MRRADDHTSDIEAGRRALAIARARDVCATLENMGVTARVIGSLATGRFGSSSDIDFLITDYPRSLKYAIEGTVEDRIQGFPFDVVYLDEVPKHKLDRFMKEAVDARYLR